MNRHQSHERGVALLISLLVMTVLLGVSASLINITLKQFQFSAIGLQSEIAFQAANAGLECIMFHDRLDYPNTSKFDIGQNSPAIRCMGASGNVSPVSSFSPIQSMDKQRYQFSWTPSGVPNPQTVCSDVTITKVFDASADVNISSLLGIANTQVCGRGSTCTVIKALGYNVPCVAPGLSYPPRAVEREFTVLN